MEKQIDYRRKSSFKLVLFETASDKAQQHVHARKYLIHFQPMF